MLLRTRRTLVAGLAGVLVITGAVGSAGPAAAAPAGADRTSTAEARRVDRVPTPDLAWAPCFEIAECATAKLPLDYDEPRGATTDVAVLRVKARDQAHKIGSLFLNPGGPGGSGTAIALAAPQFLGAELLDRFDIVGVDPRGIAMSSNVRCFETSEDQAEAYEGFNVSFPYGRAEERAYVAASQRIARGCSTTGKPLSGAMSTAEVARDMDVIRRAVGDRKLTYLGFSYGTALGQYYANMFPDRFRALVVDGVIDPIAWTGIKTGTKEILDERMHSADGAWRALAEILKRCDAVGEEYCAFAAGDPFARWASIARQIKAEPLVIEDESGSFTITYADLVGGALGILYSSDAGDNLTQQLAEIWALLEDRQSATAQAALARRITAARLAAAQEEEPYQNGLEAFLGVTCNDGIHPRESDKWIPAGARADRRAPYFGRAWSWVSSPCATEAWTVRDEDAYRGPFNRKTAAPVLYVGSFWDPATNYDASVSASRRQPGSRLLSSTNWGHTAYGTSPCADGAIEAYLLTGAVPPKGKVCDDARQPFSEPLSGATTTKRVAVAETGRPPVATPVPRSVLIGTR